MPPLDLFRFLILAAIWGASFLFMRVASPEFGPVPLILVRVGVALLCLAPFILKAEIRASIRAHAGTLVLVGIMNSALPFCLLAFATLRLEAGSTSLLNATTPLFAAVIGFAWLGLPLNRFQVFGLFMGILGVVMLTWGNISFKPGASGWAIVAALGASCSYGLSVHITRRRLLDVPARVFVGGGLIAATLVLIPISLPFWPLTLPSPGAWACALALAVFSTAFAYLLFFQLIARIGATSTAAVTFVIPVFATLWGALFLDEQLNLQVLAGMAVILAGTVFTTASSMGKSRKIFSRRAEYSKGAENRD